jgi:hypothetical protein
VVTTDLAFSTLISNHLIFLGKPTGICMARIALLTATAGTGAIFIDIPVAFATQGAGQFLLVIASSRSTHKHSKLVDFAFKGHFFGR